MMPTYFKTIFFIGCIIFSKMAFGQGEQASAFALVKQADNISIYERWVTFPKSNPPVKAREVKGVFFVRSNFAQAIALIQDEKKIYDWQKHVSEFKVFKKKDTTTWEEYSYHDIPWPVSDQDHYLVYKIDPSSTANKILLTFETTVTPTTEPVRDDVDRMTLSGSWLFEKVKDGKIKISYSIISMPSNIPRIFTDPVIRSNMLSTIRHYINILEKKK